VYVLFKFPFDFARLLEISLIEILVLGDLFKDNGRPNRSSRHVRIAKQSFGSRVDSFSASRRSVRLVFPAQPIQSPGPARLRADGGGAARNWNPGMNHSLSKTLSYWGGRLILGLVLYLFFPLIGFASGARALSPDFVTPPLVDDKPVTVTVGLYVVNLASLDEVKETFELDGYLTAIWQDDRLKFSPLLDLRVRSRNYREGEVWTPRLTMANAAEPRDRFEVTIRADSKVLERAGFRFRARSFVRVRTVRLDLIASVQQ
jgi:hypothetical protein